MTNTNSTSKRVFTNGMRLGSKFRLLGRTTEFEAVDFYLSAGFIPTVRGINRKLGVQTCARVVDVIVL